MTEKRPNTQHRETPRAGTNAGTNQKRIMGPSGSAAINRRGSAMVARRRCHRVALAPIVIALAACQPSINSTRFDDAITGSSSSSSTTT